MSDDNPAFMAYVCDECPCCSHDREDGAECNFGYEQFDLDSKDGYKAAELDKCLLTSVRWKGGSFKPVAVLVRRYVPKPYKGGPMDTLLRKYYEPAVEKMFKEDLAFGKKLKERFAKEKNG